MFALGLAKPGQNQERGRQQRRRVGRGAEHADIAALHADIPGVERSADRPDAERGDREPLQRRVRPRPWSRTAACTAAASNAVASAESRDRVGRHRFEPARHHRIGRPRQRPPRRPRPSPGICAEREAAAWLPANSSTVPASPSTAPTTWCGASRSPGSSDENSTINSGQRVIQQAGFGRRRKPQRQEVQRVIAEQAADADDPGERRLRAGRGSRPAARSRSAIPGQRADRKRHRRELERRDIAGRRPSCTASSDHIRIAVNPIRVAVRGGMRFVMAGQRVARRRARCGNQAKQSGAREARPGSLRRIAPRNDEEANQTMYCPPLMVSVEPVMAPESSAARNTTARAISSGSPRRLTGISGRMAFSRTSFGVCHPAAGDPASRARGNPSLRTFVNHSR